MEERPRQYAQYSGLYPNIEPYGIPSQEVLSPVTGGTTARGFGMPSVYTNPERAAEVAQNYADGYMAMGGEESRYRRPSSSRKASATTPTTTLAPTKTAQPAPALTPRTDAEINELINQGLSKYQPTLPDLSGYARLSDIPAPQALPDVSKFATLEDVNRAISGIPPAPVFDINPLQERLTALENRPMQSIPDVSGFATQADINRAIAGIPQPVMPTMEGLVTQEQLNRALAGLSAPVSIPNLGIGGMPQFRF